MIITNLFNVFDEKFREITLIDSEWYRNNCGVFANITKKKVFNKEGLRSEEWYRARMVWAMVEFGYPSENICVEFTIPKGSEGARSLKPDIIVFKTKKWRVIYDNWDKKTSLPDELRENMLLVMEAKDNSQKVENAVFKQIAEAMSSYIGEEVYGIYFDNEDDVLVFSKEGTHPINRYYLDKTIMGEGREKLNLTNRDDLSRFPTFSNLVGRIKSTEDVKKLNFKSNQPITEDNFADILKEVNRMQDSLNISHAQDLIVEFLMLKVADEKAVQSGKKDFFEFYITESEKQMSGESVQSFRKRIKGLYEEARLHFSVLSDTEFFYKERKFKNKSISLQPSKKDDEKFLIGIIERIQKKIILSDNRGSYNQIIFNNFGNDLNKAKEKQFFTPLDVVEMIVKIINPSNDETICDPCSGICDFLTVTHNFLNKKYEKHFNKLFAFDKDEKILKLAQLNLILNGEGNTTIRNVNSINQKMLTDGSICFDDFDKSNYDIYDWEHLDDESKDILKYDVILTNPPFGKGRDLQTGKKSRWDIKESTMELYETWLVSRKPQAIDMGIVFLENAYKSLKPGGRMGIILSNSIAGIAQWSEVRAWLMKRLRIVGIIDLPQDTFGETGVSTTVIIGYKPTDDEQFLLSDDYEVYVNTVKNVGYTVKTTDRIVVMKPVFEVDPITLERLKDSKGNEKRLTDIPNVVNDFAEWLVDNKHRYKEIYSSFDGDNIQRWEV
ncbi:HsdM family class I SAM-dependent methyltransferase [Enterococcus sp. AZ192]|uniref:HsdM family class I SAM-dependent methyltransferase n=1 Tax=unclassified Enterococcus TaxID=2608891 RepID=UPI003D27AAA6